MCGCLFQTVKGGTVTLSPSGDCKLRSEDTERFLLRFLGWHWTETPFSNTSRVSSLVLLPLVDFKRCSSKEIDSKVGFEMLPGVGEI